MRRVISRPVAIMALAVLLVAVVQSLAVACPTCGEALGHQDAAHNGVAKGFFYSILFMMGMPYLLLGTFCGCMYWKVRRARAANAKALMANVPAAGSQRLAAASKVAVTSAAMPSTAEASSSAASTREKREPVEV
ncbi:MAG TPA: hypothetical protein VHX65_19695 [Pirellulales bacterium]|jgi:hypothetical protein|nr:hypothetical protein [Pirellulales bacterium]